MNTLIALLLIEKLTQCTQIFDKQSDLKPINVLLTEIVEALDEEINRNIKTCGNQTKTNKFLLLGMIMRDLEAERIIDPNTFPNLELTEENVPELVQRLKHHMSPNRRMSLLVGEPNLKSVFYRLVFYYEVLRFYRQKNHAETDEAFVKFMWCYDDPFKRRKECLSFFEKIFSAARNCTFTHSQLMLVPDHKNQELKVVNYLKMKIVETYRLLGTNKEPEKKELERYFNKRFLQTFGLAFLNSFHVSKHEQFIVMWWFFDEFKVLLEQLNNSVKHLTYILDFYHIERNQFQSLLNKYKGPKARKLSMHFSVDVFLRQYREELANNKPFNGFELFCVEMEKLSHGKK